MKIIKVKTDSKNYDIKVGHDLLGSTPLKKLVSQKDILLIVENKEPELFIKQFKGILRKIVTMPIENEKNCMSAIALKNIAKKNQFNENQCL